MWLDAKVVPFREAVGDWCDDPVDVETDEVQELAHEHGDLGSVDAVWAEY